MAVAAALLSGVLLAASVAGQTSLSAANTADGPYPDLQFAAVSGSQVPLQTVYADMTQDRDGFLWFTTLAALFRFDGFQLRQWAFPPMGVAHVAQSPGQISETSDGALWLMSPQGPLRLAADRQAFERLAFPDPSWRTRMWSLLTVGADVWLSHNGGAVFRFDPDSKTFLPVFQAPGEDDSNTANFHVDAKGGLLLVHAGQIWRVTVAGGTQLYQGANPPGRTHSEHDAARGRLCVFWPDHLSCHDASGHSGPRMSLPSAFCGEMAFDAQGQLLLRCGRQLFRETAEGDLRPLALPLLDEALDRRAFRVDSHGVVWAADNGGIHLIDPVSARYRWLALDAGIGLAAASGGQMLLREDRDRGMWVAANGQGVARAQLGSALFRHWSPPMQDGRPARGHVRALFDDSAGAGQRLWFSSFDKRQWRLQLAADGRVTEARSFALPEDAPWGELGGFARDGQGRLWFGTMQQLWQFDERAEQFQSVPVQWPGSLRQPDITGLHRDDAGQLWMYGNFGLALRTGDRPGDWRYFPLPASATEGPTAQLYLDRLLVASDGRWWIVSERGLLVFDPEKTEWTHVHAGNSPLVTDWVQAIREQPAGTYWLALRGGGVQRFRGKVEQMAEPERWRHYGEASGLTDLMVYDLAFDLSGALWLAGGQGVTRLDPDTGSSQLFSQSEGLRQHDFNRSQTLNGPGGTLLMGGINGLTLVNPAGLQTGQRPSRPLLMEVSWNRGELKPVQGRVEVPREGADVALRWLSFHYAAPQQLRYRYRLQAEADWVEVDTSARAQFANIGAGEYAFEVQAAVRDGEWSESLKLDLVVPLPWWRTPGFLAGVAALLLLLVWGWKRQRDQRQAQLEAEVAARTRDLAGANEALQARHQVIDAQAQALGQAVQARDQLFARVSHEFRTPLSLIQLSLEALRNSHEPDREIRQGERYVHELAEMVDQLLALARGQTVAEAPVSTDVHAVVVERLAAHQPAAEKAGVRLSVGAQPACACRLTPHSLETVLNNLLGNALKYTPAGGWVKVWWEVHTELVIHVQDSGIGIPEAFRARIFEPFVRAPEAAQSEIPGFGLGLHLVALLVHKDNGRIEVDSVEGQGSHFRVSFPMQAESLQSPAALPASLQQRHAELRDQAPRPAPADMRVLVIEDHPDLRARLQALLGQHYRVEVAADGDSGLQQARAQLPDLILCDVDLPGRDGFSVCAELKDDPLTAGIPVFFLTAYVGRDHRLLGLKAQGDAYFCKPFSADELLLHIGNRLWQQQHLREAMRREFSGGEKIAPQTLVATRDETQLSKARALHEKVQALLAKNFSKPEYNIAALAADLHQDPRHLQRLFSVYAFGVTPKQMLTHYRLARAHELLQEKRPVGKVAEACGLDPKHFFAAFKARYGLLPGELAERRERA